MACTREALQYRDSRELKMSADGIEVRTGKKWRAERAVEVAKSRFRLEVVMLATGRAGLFFSQTPKWARPEGKKHTR